MADFEEPLCGCFSDIFSCCCAFIVPGGYCFIQSKAVSIATGESMVVPFILPCLLCCIGGAMNRGKIREKHKLDGSFVVDCLLHWCLGCCATTQEYREARKRENT